MPWAESEREQQEARTTLATCTALIAVNKNLTSLRGIRHLECMTSLRTVNLHMNQLRELDPAVTSSASLRHITELDVSGNDLETVQGIESLRDLVSLNLSSNRLRHVDSFSMLHHLQWLSLSFNLLEDLLGLRSLPSETLRFLDVCGNLLPRADSLRAVEHCVSLRELRVTIPRPAAGTASTGVCNASDGGADDSAVAAPPPVALLDNPLVRDSNYRSLILKVLPQLVVLDGAMVGYDPLQEPRWHSTSAASQQPRQPNLSLSPSAVHSGSRVDEYLNGLAAAGTPQRLLDAAVSPSFSPASSPAAAARAKRISRSVQTAAAPPAASTAETRPSTCHVSVGTDATAPPSSAVGVECRRDDEAHAAAIAAMQKLTRVAASLRCELDDTKRAFHEAKDSLNHERQNAAQLGRQVSALKDELARAFQNAETRESLALRLQEERLRASYREAAAAQREKYVAKIESLEQNHIAAMRTAEERHAVAMRDTVSTAAYHQLLASHTALEAAIGRLRDEVANAAQETHRRACAREVGALFAEEEDQRRVIHVAAASLRSDLAAEACGQLRRIAVDVLRAAAEKSMRTGVRSCGTFTETPVAELRHVGTQCAPPSALAVECDTCVTLRSTVADLESALRHVAADQQRAHATVQTLQQALGSVQAAFDRAQHDAQVEQEGLRRTVENLKASMAAQDAAHRQELEELDDVCRAKVDEKRSVIAEMNKREASLVARVNECEVELVALRSQLDATRKQLRLETEEHASVMSGREKEHRAQTARLVEAVQTLRNQLIAVDRVNKQLREHRCSVEGKLQEANDRELASAQRLSAVLKEKELLEAESRRVKEHLRRLLGDASATLGTV